MDLTRLTLDELRASVGEKTPTPGGGAVVGVCASIASALAIMVTRYSQGRPKTAEHEAEFEQLLEEFRRANEMFTSLAAEDIDAYARLNKVLGLNKDSPDRGTQLASAVRRAAGVPLNVMALCLSMLRKLEWLASIANPWLLSDLGIAAELICASGISASYLVRANASLLEKHAPGDESLAMCVQYQRELRESRDKIGMFLQTYST